MEYSKTYLLVHSLRSQNVTQKEIQKYTSLSQSQVSKLLNNKQKDVKQEKKVIKQFSKLLKYDKTAKRKTHTYQETIIAKTALYIMPYLKRTNSEYNIQRRSKKLSKSKDVVKEVSQGMKKYLKYKRVEEKQYYTDGLLTSSFIKEGFLQII